MLPLEEEAPEDISTRMKLGSLFLAASSPGSTRADLFREVLKAEPENADAYAGLGQSELARGNYRTASQHFQTVLRLRPDDVDAQKQLQLCSRYWRSIPLREASELRSGLSAALKFSICSSAKSRPALRRPPRARSRQSGRRAKSAQTERAFTAVRKCDLRIEPGYGRQAVASPQGAMQSTRRDESGSVSLVLNRLAQ